MKNFCTVLLTIVMIAIAFVGCGEKSGFNQNSQITVISREDGSGTRGAFIEIFGIEEKNKDGQKVDHTIESADITNSTSVMMTSVAQNEQAIGYISLGSMNESVKALNIDGAQATTENIKNGTYKISRPFNIATKENISTVAQDFINYILSADGQALVEENGYIAATKNPSYTGGKPGGKITIAGSSSVAPVMEKLKEGYLKINTNASIDMQQSDSTTGVTSTIGGVCDIGMASRELKDSEKAQGLKATTIAIDGIAVIVNHANTTLETTSAQIKDIYTGKSTVWADIKR